MPTLQPRKGIVISRPVPSPRRGPPVGRRPGPTPVAEPAPVPLAPRPAPRTISPPRPAPRQAQLGYVAAVHPSSGPMVDPLSERFVESLGAVTVHAVAEPTIAHHRTLVDLRGYRREDLAAIAEIGVHYLLSGALVAAQTIFEGLVAIDPDDAYFVMALGLTYEREGQLDLALEAYRQASRLQPGEGRAEVNAAEILLARADFKNARPLLMRAAKAAKACDDQVLENKATALLDHVSGLEKRQASR